MGTVVPLHTKEGFVRLGLVCVWIIKKKVNGMSIRTGGEYGKFLLLHPQSQECCFLSFRSTLTVIAL